MCLILKISNVKRRGFFFSVSFKELNLFKILFNFFTFGFIFGVLLLFLNKQESLNQIGLLMQKFIKSRANQNILTIFFSSFFSFFISVLALFLAGFFPLGQPVGFFMPVFYGLGLGLSTAYLYSCNGLRGFFFSVLIIAPCELLYTFILLLGSKFSIRFSNSKFKRILGKRKKNREEKKADLKTYVLRFLILFLFQILAALIDTLTTFLFVKFLD